MTTCILLGALLFAAPQRATVDVPPDAAAQAPLALHGQLRDGRETVAAELGIFAELRRAGEVLRRVSGRSDEHGAFALELTRPAEGPADGRAGAESDLLLVAWVEEPGYQRVGTVVPVQPDDEVVSRALVARAGTTALLRVVDGHGRPVLAGALEVDAYETPAPVWGRTGFAWRDFSTRPRGRVRAGTGEVELTASRALEAWLLARADGVGAGVLRVLLDPAEADQAFVVVLEGEGVLEGTLRDPEGRPLPRVELLATAAAWEAEPAEPTDLAITRGPPLELRGGGLASCRATTDSDGRFAFAGLRPGSWIVQDARRANDPLRMDLPRTPHAADLGPIELVARSYSVALSVLDPGGVPLAGLRPYCVALPEVVVRGWSRPDPGGVEVAPGVWRFDVEAGRRYACGWLDPQRGGAERIVAVGDDDYLQRVELRGAAPAAPATVSLRVQGLGGRAPSRRFGEDVWVGVRSAETGVELVGHELDHDTTTFEHSVELPPGEYVAFCELVPTPRMCGLGEVTRIDHLPVERRFTVEPGESRTVFLQPVTGGRVRLHLRLPEEVRDPRLVSEHLDDADADWGRRNDLLILGEEGPCSRVWLLRPDGPPRRLSFFYVDPTSSWGPLVVPGTSSVSFDPLPVGPQRLRVESPGFEPVEETVVIRDREVVEAAVQLRYPGR